MLDKGNQMPPTAENITESADHYGQARDVALANGWVTVCLIQRRLRLGYGSALSLLDGLVRRGVVGPLDTTDRHLVLLTNESNRARMAAVSEPVTPLARDEKPSLTIVPQNPLLYRLTHDDTEHHTASLTPSLYRKDDFYRVLSAGRQIPEKTVITRYFVGESKDGTFEVLVQCLRPAVGAPFEVESVSLVVQPESTKIAPLPMFSIIEENASDQL